MPEPRTDLVVKFGGSLLHQVDGIHRLRRWLTYQKADRIFLIVGGGEAIEAMRNLDKFHSLEQAKMHWRCIRMLDATYEVVRELLPEAEPIDRLTSWLNRDTTTNSCPLDPRLSRVYLVRIGGFYSEESSTIDRLPENWETTSDSIAVLLAKLLDIRTVVLLKSCPLSEAQSLVEMAEAGVIDRTCLALCDHQIDLRLEML